MKNLEKSHFRSLICFLIVMMFIIISLVYAFFCDSSFIVNAQENGYSELSDVIFYENRFINQSGYENSEIFNSDTYYKSVLTTSDLNTDIYFDNDYNNGISYITNDLDFNVVETNASNPQSMSLSINNCDFYYFLKTGNGYSIVCCKNFRGGKGRLVCFNGVTYCITSSVIDPFYDAGYGTNSTFGFYCVYEGIVRDGNLYFERGNSGRMNGYISNGVLIDNVHYIYQGLGTYQLIANPYLALCSEELGSSFISNVNDTLYDASYLNINYKLGVGPPQPPPNVYPDGSGGTDENNLYVNNPRWDFGSLPKWSKNVTNESYIYFRGDLNDYQVDNLDNFHFNYTYMIQFTAKGNWNDHSSGGGHGFGDNGASIIDALTSKKKTFTFKFKNPENDNTYWSQPLKTFYQAGSISSHRTRGFIYSNCLGVGESPVSFQTFIDNLDLSEFTDIKCILTCTSVLQDSEGNSSGLCESWINLYNNNEGKNSDSMGVNKEPFDNDSSNSDESQGGSSGNDSQSYGNGQIIINNTNNNTLNGGDNNLTNSITSNKNPISTLLDNLFGGGTVQDGAIGGNTISKVNDITGANNYINYMNNTLSFIPNTVWSEILIFFGICLSILVVGFILRIILDFL